VAALSGFRGLLTWFVSLGGCSGVLSGFLGVARLFWLVLYCWWLPMSSERLFWCCQLTAMVFWWVLLGGCNCVLERLLWCC